MPRDFNDSSPEYVWAFPKGNQSNVFDWSVGDFISYDCFTFNELTWKDGSLGRVSKAINSYPFMNCGQSLIDPLDVLKLTRRNRDELIIRGSIPQLLPIGNKAGNESECYFKESYENVTSRFQNREFSHTFPICQYLYDASDNRASISVRLILSDVKFPQYSNVEIYSGRSRKGTLLYVCGSNYFSKLPPQETDEPYDLDHDFNIKCNEANNTMNFTSKCGSIFMSYQNGNESYEKIKEVTNNKTFSAQFTWERTSHQMLSSHELCIDDPSWVKYAEERKGYEFCKFCSVHDMFPLMII